MTVITDPKTAAQHRYKYLDLLAMVWLAMLICGSLPSSKLIELGPFDIGAIIVVYPISYIFADCFTEVYGYKQTRRIVWTGFILLALIGFVIMPLMVALPPHPEYLDNEAFRTVFGASTLMVLATIVCFFCGEMTNSYILAKMKIWTQGKFLWMRTMGSTICGQLVDNFVFYAIAFAIPQTLPLSTCIVLWLSSALLFSLYEIFMTPVTYKIIGFLKRKEGLDVYDRGTDFNPFAITK